MKLSRLQDIVEVLPKAYFKVTGSVIMIIDGSGERIASINAYNNTITFYTSYKHFKVIEKKMIERGIEVFDRELNRQLLED